MKRSFTTIDELYKEVAAKLDADRTEPLSTPERVLLLVWWSKGLIDNGGFQYFYEMESNIYEVAGAFDSIALPEIGRACRSSATVFPDASPPASHRERNDFMDERQDENARVWKRLNRSVWRVSSDRVSENLLEYVRANRSAFSWCKNSKRI